MRAWREAAAAHKPGIMRLLVLADIDASHWKWETAAVDAVVSCGDVPVSLILDAAEAHRCDTILAVTGNHDGAAPFPGRIVDLHLRTHRCGDLVFGGLNGAWKYKPKGHFLYEQSEVEQFLSKFQPVDVFVSHNSPRGIHDRQDGVHCGFEGLASYIGRAAPALLLHGHQHANNETNLGSTRIVGVCGHRIVEARRPSR